MKAVWKRELQAMFLTPTGYVFMAFFLLVSGYFFWGYNLSSGSCDMSGFFGSVTYILVLFTPILTMRLLSEEKRSRTDQLLVTSPLPLRAMVTGKFMAAATVLALTLALTFVYPAIIAVYGRLALGAAAANYLGCFLVGCVYLSIGVLISGVCESQVTAAVATLAVNIMLQVLEQVPQLLSSGSLFAVLGPLVSWLSVQQRNAAFAAGLLSPANVLYLVSFAAVVLFVTVRLLERRRWIEG